MTHSIATAAAQPRGGVLRIGGASAFWGDSAIGIEQLVASGEVDVLVFDYLAELTMSLLARARVKDPAAGYATDFVTDVAPHLKSIAAQGIKLLSNAGGMNPQACAAALRAAAQAADVQLKIVVVQGDDLGAQETALRESGVREMFSGAPLPERMTSINAYLGAQPVAAALADGADVVITGRCVDSALALGALMHQFDWAADSYDLLAAGSLVGHLLECSTQATGGLYTDWLTLDADKEIGYPIAICESDGSFVLTKPRGTGGKVAPLVAAEQMLYEVGDPARYMLPDVQCDFTGVTIVADGEDRVRITGARGRAPGDSYKVSATWHDGYRMAGTLTIVGEQAVLKAERVGAAILARARRLFAARGLADFAETEIEVLGSERPSYGANARSAGNREVVLRVACRHASMAALSLLSREFAPYGTAGVPGTTGFTGRPKAQPVFRLFSCLWPKDRVAVSLVGDGGATRSTELVAPRDPDVSQAHEPNRHRLAALPAGERMRVPLHRLAVGRSGDKGDNVNIAVIARDPRYLPAIAAALPPERVREWFGHMVRGEVTRHDVPGVNAFNFVLTQALGGGGAASLRNDPLGKSFAQILLAHEIEVPAAWLHGL